MLAGSPSGAAYHSMSPHSHSHPHPHSSGQGSVSPSMLSLDAVRAWTPVQVADWLERNAMPKHARTFVDHEISGDILLELTQQNLKDMSIPTIGDRIRLERLIISLRRAVLPTLFPPHTTHQHHHPGTSTSPTPYSPSPPPYSSAGGRLSPRGNATGNATPTPPPLSSSAASMRNEGAPPGVRTSSKITPIDVKKSRSDDMASLRFAAGEISPDTIALMRKSDSIMNLESIKQSCVRVTGEKNETRVILLPNTSDASAIMHRILSKFNIAPDSGKFTIFVSEGESTRALTDAQLVEICSDPNRPEREKLFLRKMHTPFTFSKSGAAASGATPPAIRQKLVLLDEQVGSRPPIPRTTANKLNKFFGERPPSELISSNLTDFFPKDGVAKIERRKSRALSINQGSGSSSIGRRNKSSGSGTSGVGVAGDTSSILSSSVDSGSLLRSSLSEELDYGDASALNDVGNATMLGTDPSSPYSARHPGSASGYPSLNRATRPPPLNLLPIEARVADDPLDVSTLSPAGSASPSAVSEPHTPNSPGDGAGFEPDGAPTKWLRGALIGQGSFGAVYMGLHGITGELMAVKQVELPTEGPDTPESLIDHRVKMVKALQHEISFLKEVKHDHIVRYLGSRIEGQYFNIFLEYVPGGSIHGVLQQWNALPEPIVKTYLRQVLLGLDYLHAHEIIHRDIKAANILVDNRGCVKISDFGISKRVGPEDLVSVVGGLKRTSSAEDMLAGSGDDTAAAETSALVAAGNKTTASMGLSLQGSVYWMSPEVVKHMRYTRKSDIWSVGCLVIEMFTAKHPWPNASQVEAIFKIGSDMRPGIPDECSEEAQELMEQTFRPNYLDRPSAEELLRHPFLIA
ncbi:kinase-like domain-containing protein [Catenaria anguillulae PL171]|uniref:Kinase-like domain-containing protein n=1 Tax=Catenaria anguillulae PL171 TaxID=765915 RepID=A0A1Y2I2Y0_9FUNG|nr:kinase-like domain-containing protein [Catenaria anguillulae PL171]